MRKLKWMIALTACAAGNGILHAEQAAPPSTHPAAPARQPIPKDETPRQALLRGCKVNDAMDVGAVMDTFHYVGDEEKRLVRLQSECGLAMTRLEQAARAKLGKEASDALVHALGEQTETDVEAADIRVDGDRAIVQFKGQPQPAFTMIRVDGGWKVDAHETLASMTAEDRKDLAVTCAKIRDRLPQFGRDLAAGKIDSQEAAAAAAKKFMESLAKPEEPPRK